MPHANGINGLSEKSDVCIVGGGPAGLTLAVILARLGLKLQVLDDRPDQTAVGRADGIQPKTIETLQMLGLGDELLRQGVKVYDICMWRGSNHTSLKRIDRQVHYPASVVDVLHPFILLCHQGMVEGALIDDLRLSGVEVQRNSSFTRFRNSSSTAAASLEIEYAKDGEEGTTTTTTTTTTSDYIVGCDGARSKVREGIPDTHAVATPHESFWGVLDGELDTDFPDVWSKTVVFSEEYGSILIIPRERNMTRFYIELKRPSSSLSSSSTRSLGGRQEYVMDHARKILAPYKLEWRSVEWFGNYQVAQRVAARFADPEQRAFIAGDASHTHSPKAAQGMNTSMHDAWNLGWKLNLAVRGFAKTTPGENGGGAGGGGRGKGGLLLQSYEDERKKVAHDLINFDFEHANDIAAGDIKKLAENFRINTRFISGAGIHYDENALNWASSSSSSSSSSSIISGGMMRPGTNPPPAMVSRYIDANPVHAQLDIPMLGQFRIYVFVGGGHEKENEADFLSALSDRVRNPGSLMMRLSEAAKTSYREKPRAKRLPHGHEYVQAQRYTPVSELFTFAMITSSDKSTFELDSLPPLFSDSRWTVYLDDAAHLDTKGLSCTEKWLGGLARGQVALANVRPDGYVGSVQSWDVSAGAAESGRAAARWLDEYYGGFLQVPSGQ